MKRGKYEKVVPVTRKKHGLNTRIVTLMLALTLMLGVAVGGTIAWLTDKTEEVVNTFTVGNIDITLDETTGEDYKMVPGNTITKDPKVTVEAKSEDCWLFVKVEETNLTNFITYVMADGWISLDDVAGVYYREVTASDADQEFAVLQDNQVTVNEDVTKEMMDAIDEGKANPKLTFTAYAIQQEGFGTAAAAWTEVSK